MRCRHCGAPWLTEFAPCSWCGLSYQGQIQRPTGEAADLNTRPPPPRPLPTSVPSSGAKVLK